MREVANDNDLPRAVRERAVCREADSREDWLAARRRFVTGSEVATLFGEHAYTKWPAVLAEKVSGESDFDATQDHVRQGSLAEPFIAAYLADRRGIETVPCGTLIRDSVEPRLAATPDYLHQGLDGWFNVQFKFTKAGRHYNGECVVTGHTPKIKGEWGPFLPSYIWWQVQAEMAVLDVSSTMVVAYHRTAFPRWGSDDDQLGVYLVARDDEAIERLRKTVAALPAWEAKQ